MSSSAATESGAETPTSIAEQFDNPQLSDVKFVIGDEAIHVQKALLKNQSSYFRSMFEGPWKDKGSDPIVVTRFSYCVYKEFLRYFYTGKVDLPVTETIELLKLASACSEDVLKTLCQENVGRMVTIDNCATVYSIAVRCRAQDVVKLCCRFAADKMQAIQRTSAFAKMSEYMCMKFHIDVRKALCNDAMREIFGPIADEVLSD